MATAQSINCKPSTAPLLSAQPRPKYRSARRFGGAVCSAHKRQRQDAGTSERLGYRWQPRPLMTQHSTFPLRPLISGQSSDLHVKRESVFAAVQPGPSLLPQFCPHWLHSPHTLLGQEQNLHDHQQCNQRNQCSQL